MATITICTMALSLDLNLVKIHTAMTISASPINMVRVLEKSWPRMPATICSCRGTRFKTLQKNPLVNQTAAMKQVSMLFRVAFSRSFLFQVDWS